MKHVASLGVSVHPDYWGRGIATQLVKFTVRIAKKKGLKRLEIETIADNIAMRHAAEKSGFRFESIRKNRIQKDGSCHDEASYFRLL